MKIGANSISQEQFNSILERMVECAFREGALWQKSGGEEFVNIERAIEIAKLSIVHDGSYVNDELYNKIVER